MTPRPTRAAAILLAAAALPATAGFAAAQVTRDTTRLAPIVVTATRTPIATTELANGVTVIEGASLRRAGVATVSDALRTVPSLALAQAGSYGAQTSMFLRGGESDYVRVLVDGVPVNQAGGFIDLANLTTENVERIEVVRGPTSVLYGSDAMTGVVQIITRKGAGALRGEAEARGGSYGTADWGASLAGGRNGAALSAGVQRQQTDGINAFNSGYANLGASGRLALTPDAKSDIQLAVRYRDGTFHYPTDGAGNVVDSSQQQRSRQAAVTLDAGRHFAPHLEARVLLGYVSGRDSTENLPDSPGDTLDFYSQSRSSTSRRTADLRANLGAGALLLTLGAALDDEREQGQSGFTSQFFSSADTTDVRRTNKAAYAQAVGERGRLSWQGGVRLDDNQRFGSFFTWRLGGALRVAPETRLRVNAGTAFKEPTFAENYTTAFSVGNPDLVPERSTSVEAGLEQSVASGRVTLSLTGFAQRFRDMIQYTFVTANPGDPNYHNVASARADGVELEAAVRASRTVNVAAQYTWLHTEAQDSGYGGLSFEAGRELLRRPAHSGSVSAEWRPAPDRALGARVMYVGTREDLDFSGLPSRVTLPAYGRLDLWGAIALLRVRGGADALSLTLRADNVTGASYQEIRGFATPGRRVLVGARFGATR